MTSAQAADVFSAPMLLGRSTLIVGEVNAGKTFLTARLIDVLIGAGLASRLAVADFAPTIPPELGKRSPAGVGGRIPMSCQGGGWEADSSGHFLRQKFYAPDGVEILSVAAELIPPRLASRTEAEADGYAASNDVAVRSMLAAVMESGRDIVVVNDATFALQARDAVELDGIIEYAQTFLGNAYLGDALRPGGFSLRERGRLERLMKNCDRVVRLEPPGIMPAEAGI